MSTTTYKVASVSDVEALAAAWSDEFLTCRTKGHAWKTARAKREKHGVVRVWDWCTRCKMNVVISYDRSGDIIGRTYDPPKGYRSVGLGRIDATGNSVLRRETINRIINAGLLEQ